MGSGKDAQIVRKVVFVALGGLVDELDGCRSHLLSCWLDRRQRLGAGGIVADLPRGVLRVQDGSGEAQHRRSVGEEFAGAGSWLEFSADPRRWTGAPELANLPPLKPRLAKTHSSAMSSEISGSGNWCRKPPAMR